MAACWLLAGMHWMWCIGLQVHGRVFLFCYHGNHVVGGCAAYIVVVTCNKCVFDRANNFAPFIILLD